MMTTQTTQTVSDTIAVVALVLDDDYAHSLSLLLDIAGVQSIITTNEDHALDLLTSHIPAMVLLDTRLRARLTPIFDTIQCHAINRSTQLIFLVSSAVLPVGDHLRLPMLTVDRHNAGDIVLAVRQQTARSVSH